MTPPKGYDRFMVVNEISANPKVARLSDAEFRCLVQGVWALASKSSPRGYLLVGHLPANEQDIANQARCSVQTARRTMKKLRELHMLDFDPETGAERCHDWDAINPAPKTDNNGARRQALHRDTALRGRIRERDAGRCRYCDVEVRWNDRRSPIGGTYDHVDPNGPNAEWNLVVACRACNSRKCDKTLEEAGMHLLPEPECSRSVLNREVGSSTPEVEGEEEASDVVLGMSLSAGTEPSFSDDEVRI